MTSVKRQLNMDADDIMANGKETPKRAKRRVSSIDGVCVCVCVCVCVDAVWCVYEYDVFACT